MITKHWTRAQQIANAIEDGTLAEIRPPLTDKQKEKYAKEL